MHKWVALARGHALFNMRVIGSPSLGNGHHGGIWRAVQVSSYRTQLEDQVTASP